MVEMDSTSEFSDEATDREHARRLQKVRREAVARAPLVTASTAARWLGRTQPALTELANQGRVISVRWENARRYPAFQFDPERQRLRPRLSKILGHFTPRERDEGWPVFLWFATPQKSLNDECPCDVLALDPARVLEAIRREREPTDW